MFRILLVIFCMATCFYSCVTPNKGWALQGKIKVVPNIVKKDVTGKIMVISNKNEFTYVEILDSAQKVVRPVQIFQKQIVIDVSLYEPGIYYAHVVNKTVKFVIEK